MSSMRNAIQRRPHRERAHPLERQKWGILEKHKDYSLRAADYNAKQTRLRALRAKAKDRNPDEFYFAMMNPANKISRTTGKRFGDRGGKEMGMDTVRLLKTQDLAYLRTVGMRAKRELEKVREGVILSEKMGEKKIGGRKGGGQHVVFVEDREAQKEYARSVEEEDGEVVDEEESQAKGRERRKKERRQAGMLARLEAAKMRAREIEKAERELDLQRAKMNKTLTTGAGGVNKKGSVWKVMSRKK